MKFKIGDRILKRGETIKGTIYNVPICYDKTQSIYVGVKWDVGNSPTSPSALIHPELLRRLVKRKRREIWVNEYEDGLTGSYYYASKKDAEKGNTTGDGYRRTIRFVEAKEKK